MCRRSVVRLVPLQRQQTHHGWHRRRLAGREVCRAQQIPWRFRLSRRPLPHPAPARPRNSRPGSADLVTVRAQTLASKSRGSAYTGRHRSAGPAVHLASPPQAGCTPLAPLSAARPLPVPVPADSFLLPAPVQADSVLLLAPPTGVASGTLPVVRTLPAARVPDWTAAMRALEQARKAVSHGALPHGAQTTVRPPDPQPGDTEEFSADWLAGDLDWQAGHPDWRAGRTGRSRRLRVLARGTEVLVAAALAAAFALFPGVPAVAAPATGPVAGPAASAAGPAAAATEPAANTISAAMRTIACGIARLPG
jgi:hypothetical protein